MALRLTKVKADLVQFMLITLIWLLLFAVPVLFGDFEYGIDWKFIFKTWKEYSLLFILFLVNRFILMPKLFFNQKVRAYFIAIISITILFTIAIFLVQEFYIPNHHRPMHDMRPGEPMFGPPPRKAPPEAIPAFANFFIMSILIIGFDTSLMFFSKWMQSEQNKLKAEKDSYKAQLSMLKTQVSPHFFMNTLNNIHALIDYDTTGAQDATIRLSKLMRYLLYESEQEKVSLSNEIEFLKSFVELMKIRYADTVDIQFRVKEPIPDKTIPPLLFTSYVENTFKHGVSYKGESYIRINISFIDNHLIFTTENSNHKKLNEASGGIGMTNSKKRLDILYGSNYDLQMSETKEAYSLNLKLPL